MSPALSPLEISRWARNNKKLTRLLLVGAHLLLTLLAYKMGTWLYDLNVLIPAPLLWLALVLSLLVFFVYPSGSATKKSNSGKQGFAFRKICDGMLAVCTFLMIVQQSNQAASTGNMIFLSNWTSSLQASLPAPARSTPEVAKKTWREQSKGFLNKFFKWKERKTFLENKFRKIEKKYPSPTTGEKVLLTVLGAVGAIVLFYLVALAACSLSCNGAETAGTIVAVVGIAGILFLFYLLMRHLYKKKPEEQAV